MGPLKGKHARAWIVSPSCKEGIDPLWDGWRAFIRQHYDWSDEATMFTEYDEEKLASLVDMHGRVNAELKKAGKRKLHAACLVLDDLADGHEFHNNNNLSAQIFLRGRHMGFSASVFHRNGGHCQPPFARRLHSCVYSDFEARKKRMRYWKNSAVFIQ